MTNEPLKATQPLPDAYLFSNEWGEHELLLSCHGEQAQRLLEHGWTCSELFARAPSHHDLIEALRVELVWHEDHDKAISKQPNANTGDNGWRRMEHQERIAALTAILTKAEAGHG